MNYGDYESETKQENCSDPRWKRSQKTERMWYLQNMVYSHLRPIFVERFHKAVEWMVFVRGVAKELIFCFTLDLWCEFLSKHSHFARKRPPPPLPGEAFWRVWRVSLPGSHSRSEEHTGEWNHWSSLLKRLVPCSCEWISKDSLRRRGSKIFYKELAAGWGSEVHNR